MMLFLHNPEGDVLSLSKQVAFSAESCHPFGIMTPARPPITIMASLRDWQHSDLRMFQIILFFSTQMKQ
jgi:hypothetical protein